MQFKSFHWLSHHGLYHALQYGKRKRDFLGRFGFYFVLFAILWGCFNKTIIPLALVGYETTIANSALRASLAIYHLISKARS